VTFLAALGDGFLDTPKVVKTDELAVEVYWHAPNLSKQRIIGRRDTLLLPTDIQYHRDHLDIVQNNFPDFIRIGDGGDEVRDVPQASLEWEAVLIDRQGRRHPFRGVNVVRVRDGRFESVRAYFDPSLIERVE